MGINWKCAGWSSGFSLCLLLSPPCFSEPMSIGFPEFSPDLNIIQSDEPAAKFVRAAVTAPLLLPFDSGRQGEGEVLSDYFRANPDYTVWSVRLRSEAKRSDGGVVNGRDVITSLSRCSKEGGLPGFKSATSRVEDIRTGGRERWIDLNVEKLSPENVRELIARIGECPILEAKSTAIFGAALGRGANLIGSGAFRISDFMPGKRFELKRLGGVASSKKHLPNEIVVRGFADSMTALNSIRVGGVSGFFTGDEAVLAKAAKDETLLIDRCRDGLSLVYRRGVSIPCFERLGVTDIRDVG